MLLAVSDAASAGVLSASTVWSFYYFQQDLVGTVPNADTGNFADYPTLGIDANALYIGCNMFTSAPSFAGTTGFVVRKTSILSGGAIVVTAFRSLITSSHFGPYTPQGVDNFDLGQTSTTAGYFIGVSNNVAGRLVVRRVSDSGGTPTISSNINVAVNSTEEPASVPHLGNTGGTLGNLDAIDSRLFGAFLRKGRLWTAHNIEVDSTGTALKGGGRNGARWYELNASSPTATPNPVQIGTVFDPVATNPRFYWIPAVTVSGQGHAALGCSIAGANERANAAFTGRLASDSLGTMQAPTAYTSTAASYNPRDGSGNPIDRWGD